ncbi:MAG: hypothetical protein A2X94_10795 [Bdellovibrionales bacterium GWB1_55_8]|nr:MAG: hypothetical protein A2X94_10795 [Bdellovibrionales bacterium GWB1_55_8]
MRIIGLVTILVLATACGSKGTVTFKSGKSVTTSSASRFAVSGFRGCVGSIDAYDESGKLIGSEGISVSSQDLPVHFEFVGSEGKTFGSGEMPVGDKLSKIVLKMTSSSSNCPADSGGGAAPQLQLNAFQTSSSEDTSLTFNFNPAIEVKAGDTINLNAQAIVDALSSDADISSANLSQKANAASGTATK